MQILCSFLASNILNIKPCSILWAFMEDLPVGVPSQTALGHLRILQLLTGEAQLAAKYLAASSQMYLSKMKNAILDSEGQKPGVRGRQPSSWQQTPRLWWSSRNLSRTALSAKCVHSSAEDSLMTELKLSHFIVTVYILWSTGVSLDPSRPFHCFIVIEYFGQKKKKIVSDNSTINNKSCPIFHTVSVVAVNTHATRLQSDIWTTTLGNRWWPTSSWLHIDHFKTPAERYDSSKILWLVWAHFLCQCSKIDTALCNGALACE